MALFHPFFGWVIFLCVCVCVYYIYIHLSVDGHLGFLHFLTIVNNAAMIMGACIFLVFWFSLVWFGLVWIYTQEWNCWVIVLFVVFWETSVLFSTVAALICIPTNSYKSSFFSTSSPVLLFVFFLMVALLTYGKWRLTVVLISVSVMINNVEHLFMCRLTICMSSMEKMSIHVFCPFFDQVVFWCWVV